MTTYVTRPRLLVVGVGCNRALGIVASYGPIVPIHGDRWVWSIGEMTVGGGETEVLGENVPQCYFICHRCSGIEPGLLQ